MPAELAQAKARILELLGEHSILALATLRPDGWPQTTMVGYVHDDLTIYFAAALESQKVANIERDPRVSIALGHTDPTRLRGLSMAAHAEAVTSLSEIEAVNALLRERYAETAPFSPRATGSVLMRAMPLVISVIDLGKGPGEPMLVSVADQASARRIETTDKTTGKAHEVSVHAVRSYDGGYRPGAPP